MITETDLATLDVIKAFLPIQTTSDDAVLQRMLSGCSGDFLRATRRPDLLEADYEEVRQGDGSRRLVLFHWPIASIETLTVAGVVIPASANKMDPGYYIDDDIDPERVFNLYLNAPYCFTDGASIEVAYTAGYATAPPDVQLAVCEWVAFRYKMRPNQGTPQRKLAEGESVQQSQADAPETTKACIERYCRRIPSVSRRYDEEQAHVMRNSKR